MSSEPAGAVEEIQVLQQKAAAWKFLHDLFRPPSTEQWKWLHATSTLQAWRLLAEFNRGSRGLLSLLPLDYQAYQETFLAAFEVGEPHPPCPLMESHWIKSKPASALLHENLLFYSAFGLKLSGGKSETADFLSSQLEFMHYLGRLGFAAASDGDRDRLSQIQRAEADFLNRHLLSWLSPAAERAKSEFSDEWPAALLGCLFRFAIVAAGTAER